MIRSFADKLSAALFAGHYVKAVPREVAKRARTKLLMIDGAMSLADLRVPPGNRLEALRGDRAGQHSIRVNDQWRICFVWRDGGADAVSFCDYHG
jgi:toxin HigB-1